MDELLTRHYFSSFMSTKICLKRQASQLRRLCNLRQSVSNERFFDINYRIEECAFLTLVVILSDLMVANLLAVTRGIFTDEKIITELEIFLSILFICICGQNQSWGQFVFFTNNSLVMVFVGKGIRKRMKTSWG